MLGVSRNIGKNEQHSFIQGTLGNLLVRYSKREGLSPAGVPTPDLPYVNRTGSHSPCLPNSANGPFIS